MTFLNWILALLAALRHLVVSRCYLVYSRWPMMRIATATEREEIRRYDQRLVAAKAGDIPAFNPSAFFANLCLDGFGRDNLRHLPTGMGDRELGDLCRKARFVKREARCQEAERRAAAQHKDYSTDLVRDLDLSDTVGETAYWLLCALGPDGSLDDLTILRGRMEWHGITDEQLAHHLPENESLESLKRRLALKEARRTVSDWRYPMMDGPSTCGSVAYSSKMPRRRKPTSPTGWMV